MTKERFNEKLERLLEKAPEDAVYTIISEADEESAIFGIQGNGEKLLNMLANTLYGEEKFVELFTTALEIIKNIDDAE